MKRHEMQPAINTHTIVSGHSWSTLQENVNTALSRGLSGLCMTEHGPAIPGGESEIIPNSQQMLPDDIGGITIYKDIEANLIDYRGILDVPDKYLPLTEFAIASFHVEVLKPGFSRPEHTGISGGPCQPVYRYARPRGRFPHSQ